MTANRYDRMLRWYPPQWRSRYGDEMQALLEDTYVTAADVPLRTRVTLVRSGVAERLRAAGLMGAARSEDDRLRAASFLVLVGWALCVVAIAIFGKVTDNWFNESPRAGRWVASSGYNSSGYNTVTIAAAVGCGVVLLAVVATVPSFIGLLRNGGWRRVRGAVLGTLGTALFAAALLAIAVDWAHHLSAHDRNGGLPVYGWFFVTVSIAVVVALGVATWAAIEVGRRLDLPSTRLRLLAVLAVVLTGVMVLSCIGLVAWWASESVHAQGVLLHGIGNGVPYTSSSVPPTLLASGVLLLVGLVLAAWGSLRIAGTLGRGRAAT